MSDAGSNPGQYEQSPPPRRRVGQRRLRLELGLAAAVLLVVALLARGLTHGSGNTPATTTTPSQTHSAAQPTHHPATRDNE